MSIRTLVAVLFSILLLPVLLHSAELRFERVPDAGVQPVLRQDAQGTIHLLYFLESNAEDGSGHYYYRRYLEVNRAWTDPVQVSTDLYARPHLIARADMAVDTQQRVHVTWHTDYPLHIPEDVDWLSIVPEYFYTRSAPGRPVFEPERSIVHDFVTAGAESGAALSVYGSTVSLVWHGGNSEDGEINEAERAVYQVLSHDHGKTFGPATLISDPDKGACGCCGLAAAYNGSGDLQVVFRSAIDNVGRHTQLLERSDGPNVSSLTRIHDWELDACPVSTNAVAGNGHGENYAVFETSGQVYRSSLDRQHPVIDVVSAPTGKDNNKHPVMAFNNNGESLVAWNKGVGVNGGGKLRLRLYDAAGKPVPVQMDDLEIPMHSAAAVAALPDGTFLVLY